MSRSVVERVARESTGRLVALLARRSGDLALAEDALSTALVAALEQWPEDGVPTEPEAWLYTVARRALSGAWRKQAVRDRKAHLIADLQSVVIDHSRYWPDERLPLLFVCAHPSIAPAIRAPLMLQAVLGMTADALGPLMGVEPKTMGQRLWRAKRKIRDAGIPFAVPEGPELIERMGSVLDAIYGLFGVGWSQTGRGALADEAMWLSEVVLELIPDDPEVLGLRALFLYAEARRDAAREGGVFVPLDAQDPTRWDPDAIRAADDALSRAGAARRLGPFQLEAAIQSALVHGRLRGQVDHAAIDALYDGLVQLAPTLGAQVGRAAARASHRGLQAGLDALDAIEGAERFQPWWAVRAALLAELGHPESAEAYAQATALTDDPVIRDFLEKTSMRNARTDLHQP